MIKIKAYELCKSFLPDTEENEIKYFLACLSRRHHTDDVSITHSKSGIIHIMIMNGFPGLYFYDTDLYALMIKALS